MDLDCVSLTQVTWVDFRLGLGGLLSEKNIDLCNCELIYLHYLDQRRCQSPSVYSHSSFPQTENTKAKLDESLPANAVNNRCVANAVTLKSTFRLP